MCEGGEHLNLAPQTHLKCHKQRCFEFCELNAEDKQDQRNVAAFKPPRQLKTKCDLKFNSEDNYLEKFYSIEDNPKGIKIDVEDDLENFINEFVKNNNIDKEDIIENKFFIKKLFENLENKWGEFEIKELAQILGCEKKKLYRKKRGCNK